MKIFNSFCQAAVTLIFWKNIGKTVVAREQFIWIIPFPDLKPLAES